MSSHNFPKLLNDRILRAARGEDVDQVPVWVMRQAGRYLPEFQQFRQKHDFFTICRTPEYACEVTLMPIRKYALDAAIIFSDILVIPQAVGLEVVMLPGVGPSLPQPLVEPSDLDRLQVEGAVSRLQYVGDAITLTRKRLEGQVPLFGFAGGPWTIMSYMIEGGGSKTMSKSKKWLYKYPEASETLLNLLTQVTIDYLVMQVKSGAQILQLFESNCEYLSPELFDKFLAPKLSLISSSVKKQVAAAGLDPVPFVLFCKGGLFCLKQQAQLGYDVLGLDWTIPIEQARSIVGPDVTLQGNLDPTALYSEAKDLRHRTVRMVKSFGKSRFIANLGHGIYPDAPVESVKVFVDAVHEAFNE